MHIENLGNAWCAVFLVVGVLLGMVGATLLSGMGQFLVICLGVLVVILAVYRRAGTDYTREPPVPPGSHSGPPGM
jgi:peptidoglycan/LPS O-acetylase OafA/YrhL